MNSAVGVGFDGYFRGCLFRCFQGVGFLCDDFAGFLMNSGKFCITGDKGLGFFCHGRGDNNREDRTKTLAIPILLDILKLPSCNASANGNRAKVSRFKALETASLVISTVAQKVMIALKSN